LREHVTALLIVDEKHGLSDLQRHIFGLISSEVQREAGRLKESDLWKKELALQEKNNAKQDEEAELDDSYCFELLTMLVSLVGT